MIEPLKIGNVSVGFPVVLAPMAGYTDAAFRSLCRDFHCGMAYTEVINAQAVVHGSKLTMHMLETAKNERPAGAHIYGSDPQVMAEAAAIIEKLGCYDLIDVNCGCPVRKIVARGAGAALMNDPGKIAEIVRAIGDAVTLPVTIKTRIGPSPDRHNISEIAQAAEKAGAGAIAIHARYTSCKHSGASDWNALARIKSECSIPIIGNGGVKTAEDALRMFNETGVDGVMIGRAAVGNPWIFDEIFHIVNSMDYRPHSIEEHRKIIIEHLDRLISLKAKDPKYRKRRHGPYDQGAARHFRGHLFRYLSGFHGWNRIKRDMQTMNSREAVIRAVEDVLHETG